MTGSPPRAGLDRARRLIALQALVGVLAGVALAGLTTFLVVVWGQRQATAAQLDDLVASRGTTRAPAGSWVVSLRPDGRRTTAGDVPPGFPSARQRAAAAAAGPEGATQEVYAGESEFLVTARLVEGETVVAGVEVSAQESERNRLLAGLLGATVVAGGVAAVLGARLARRAVGAWDEALQRQEQFVADASHELRTPLARMALRARLLRDGARAGASSRVLADDAQLLSDEAAAMGALVEDLLHAATLGNRPDAGDLVDLSAVAAEVVRLDQVRAEERGVHLTARLSAVPPVRGVEAALHRALGALVDNALRHARAQVEVVVEPVARGTDRQVRLVVGDDGPGISTEEALHVFDRFSRGTDSGRGFGLGLALVRDVVENHGGRVDAEPVLSGTRFTVLLPAAGAEA